MADLWPSSDALAVLETGVAEEPKDLEEAVEVDDGLAAAPKAAVKSPRKRRTTKTTAVSTEANEDLPVEGEATVSEGKPGLATKKPPAKKRGRKGAFLF